jgi:hypothetical protein
LRLVTLKKGCQLAFACLLVRVVEAVSWLRGASLRTLAWVTRGATQTIGGGFYRYPSAVIRIADAGISLGPFNSVGYLFGTECQPVVDCQLAIG